MCWHSPSKKSDIDSIEPRWTARDSIQISGESRGASSFIESLRALDEVYTLYEDDFSRWARDAGLSFHATLESLPLQVALDSLSQLWVSCLRLLTSFVQCIKGAVLFDLSISCSALTFSIVHLGSCDSGHSMENP